MNDHIIRVISESGHIRAIGALTTSTASIICKRHGTNRVVTDSLARTVTVSVLMSALLKDKQKLAIKFEGNGPVKKLIAESDATGRVRGYAGVPNAEPANGSSILGNAGLVTVVKDIGLRQPYTGTVHLQSGNIADDIAFYLTESEQIPSAVGIGTFVDKSGELLVSGGFLIQSLPSNKTDNTGSIESMISVINSLPPMSELLLRGDTPEKIISKIFSEVPYKVLYNNPASFYCDCNRNKFENGLLSLGHKELVSISNEHEDIETVCEFCKEKYSFTKVDINSLINELGQK